jgi:hypothetical protein
MEKDRDHRILLHRDASGYKVMVVWPEIENNFMVSKMVEGGITRLEAYRKLLAYVERLESERFDRLVNPPLVGGTNGR